MKKIELKTIFIFVFSLTIFVASAKNVREADIQIGDLCYNLNEEEGTAEVTCEYVTASGVPSYSYTLPSNITVPSTIDYNGKTYLITRIGRNAFDKRTEIISVELPNTLTYIDTEAFNGCSNLRDIVIPESVTVISDEAFSRCSSLLSVTLLGDNTSIFYNAFYNCTRLKDFKGWCADIGKHAFWGTRIEVIHIGNNCKQIGYAPFGLVNTSLKKIDIQDISHYINIENIYETYADGPYNKPSNVAHHLSINGEEIVDLEIPYGVETIKAYAFYGIRGIRSVSIPATVSSIQSGAFSFIKPEEGEFEIENVYCYETWNKLSAANFSNYVYDNATLHVPVGLYDKYYMASGWGKFLTIVDDLTGTGEIIEAQSITFKEPSVNLKYQSTMLLELTVEPAETTRRITWSSSNDEAVVVSNDGVIEGVGPGSAVITATCGKLQASCEVNVTGYIHDIIINQDSVTLTEGDYATISISNSPESDKYPIYISIADESIAKTETNVISLGFGNIKINGLSVGTTTLTATCEDVTATCEVTVLPIKAEKITLNLDFAELEAGQTCQLSAIVSPSNTSDKTIVWSSSNPKAAEVDDKGLVTALSIGTTAIKAQCGDVSASCLITVTDDAGIDSLLAIPESKISVYSIEGILIRKDCKAEDLKTLTKGIYIIVSGKERYKIYL